MNPATINRALYVRRKTRLAGMSQRCDMITAMAKDALVAHFLNHWKKWLTLILIAAPMAVVVAAFNYRDDIAVWAGYATTVTGAATVPNDGGISAGARLFRDFIVLTIAVIGIVLATVRAIVLHSQAETAKNQFELANSQFQHQTDAAKMQYNQAESRMFDERFSTSAELMAKEIAGKPAIAARISGINIMDEVANAAPDVFLTQTVKTMVAYIKDNAQTTAKPTKEEGKPLPDEARVLGEDVKAAFAVIGGLFAKREGGGISGMLSPDILDFSNADFSHLNLNKQQVPEVRWFKKWREADLSGADLHRAELKHADFTGAIMHGTDLSRAELGGANLCYAQLQGASLFHAYLQEPPPVLHDPDFPSSKADFYWANLSYAHVDFERWQARFHATDFSHAVIKKGPFSYDDVCGKIWHSEQEEFANIRQQDSDNWTLGFCLETSTSALVGAFRNFSQRNDAPGQSFREYGLKRLSRIPSDFPSRWRGWLFLNSHLHALRVLSDNESE